MKNNYALLLILTSIGCDFDLLEKLPCKIDNEIKRDNGFCERKKEGNYCHYCDKTDDKCGKNDCKGKEQKCDKCCDKCCNRDCNGCCDRCCDRCCDDCCDRCCHTGCNKCCNKHCQFKHNDGYCDSDCDRKCNDCCDRCCDSECDWNYPRRIKRSGC
ncbi:MAG: hypothetical protein IKA39_00915 [Clostridia bacterium]|nr:hypothetical protein [Clostridia bacterium]